MKYLLMLDTPFWMLISIGLGSWVHRLRKTIRGLDEPELLLSRGERRAWARKRLAREEQALDEAAIRDFNTPKGFK